MMDQLKELLQAYEFDRSKFLSGTDDEVRIELVVGLICFFFGVSLSISVMHVTNDLITITVNDCSERVGGE